jgi:hypothetical protein
LSLLVTARADVEVLSNLRLDADGAVDKAIERSEGMRHWAVKAV